MPNYRRWHDGSLYFFTLVTQDRREIFRHEMARRLLREAMESTRAERLWTTVAIVLLPDHLHLIWRMSGDDLDYSTRIGAIKKRFTRAYLAAGGSEGSVSDGGRKHRRRGVWQQRFWEHTNRDARDFHLHVDYIHTNPVKHGLVNYPRDWAWSSFHRYVEMDWYEPDWVGAADLPGNVEYVWGD